MSELKLPAASGGGSISIKGPSSSGSDTDLLDTSGNLHITGNIGIGETDAEEALHITHASAPGLQLEATSGGPYKSLIKMGGNDMEIRGSSGQIQFFQGNADGDSSSEKLRISSHGGITFNGDTAAANCLDDYEEGTFTPSWVGADTAGSTTYSTNLGSYTKIGNLVNYLISISIWR